MEIVKITTDLLEELMNDRYYQQKRIEELECRVCELSTRLEDAMFAAETKEPTEAVKPNVLEDIMRAIGKDIEASKRSKGWDGKKQEPFFINLHMNDLF